MSDEQRIGDFLQRLLAVSKVTDERQIANGLTGRLGSAAFRVALNEPTEDGSNYWSKMLKAVVVKLNGERKSTLPDLLAALSKLVEKANKCGALFDGETVHAVVGHILQALRY